MYRSVTSDVHLLEQRKNLLSALHSLPLAVARKSAYPVVESLAQSVAHNSSYNLSGMDTRSLEWMLECLAFAIQDAAQTANELEERLASIKYCVSIYTEWLSVLIDPSGSRAPDPLRKLPNKYAQIVLWHLYHVFDNRKGVVSNEHFIGWQSFYCKKILRLLESLMCCGGNAELHREIVLLTIGVADAIFAEQANRQLLTHLNPVLAETAFRIWVQAADSAKMTDSLWKTVYLLSDRWINVGEVLEQYGSVCHQYSDRIVNREPDRLVTGSLANLYGCWYRFLFMFVDPVGSIQTEENVIRFLRVIEDVGRLFQDYSSLDSLFHLFGHWVYKICLMRKFPVGRNCAVRFAYQLVSSRRPRRALHSEYTLRLTYLTYDLLDYNNPAALSVLLESARDMYRYNRPDLMITVDRLLVCLNMMDPLPDEIRASCIQLLLSASSIVFHTEMPQGDKVQLRRLLSTLLVGENDPSNFRTLLCMIRLVDLCEQKLDLLLVPEICECLLSRWADNYELATSCIEYLALTKKTQSLSDRAALSLCDFIKAQLSKDPCRHVRQMHTAVVLAFECLGMPEINGPSLFQRGDVFSKLTEVIKLGLSGESPTMADPERPASRRVENAAYRLLDRLTNEGKGAGTVLSGTLLAAGNQHILATDGEVTGKTCKLNVVAHTSCGHSRWRFETEFRGRPFTRPRHHIVQPVFKAPDLTRSVAPFPELSLVSSMFKDELDAFNKCMSEGYREPTLAKRTSSQYQPERTTLSTHPLKVLLAQWNCLSLKSAFYHGAQVARPLQASPNGLRFESTLPTATCAVFYVRKGSKTSLEFRGSDFLSNNRLDKRFFELLKSLGRIHMLNNDFELDRITLREIDGISCEIRSQTPICNARYVVASDITIRAAESANLRELRSLTLSVIYFENLADMDAFQFLSDMDSPVCGVCLTDSGLYYVSLLNQGRSDLPLANGMVVQPSVLAQCLQEFVEMVCWRDSFEVDERNSGCAERRAKIHKWISQDPSSASLSSRCATTISVAYQNGD